MVVGGAGVGAWVGAWVGACVGVEVCAPPPPVLGPIMYTFKKKSLSLSLSDVG